ncbi:hypothetical protein [Mastigocoleus testarum]|uniref:Uncharacterized protein n=1 Tax=Mastigocoleus testarum BC008 TaxID=371196 RepID=A0A0V7ZMT1_9CYAN|nr:hypothetical protein [Mastigocoleus testarum]KST65816.1 hypothetical protein BC008_22815 [Mastigocoleus testarum BC008]
MTDKNIEESSAIVEVTPQTNEMVEKEMAGASDDVKNETKALIDAIKKRAQVEAQSAGTLTRETYLNAVRQARQTIEDNPIIERDRIEHAFDMIQQEAQKNWDSVVKEIQDLGDRLQEAAQAAWDILTAERPKS